MDKTTSDAQLDQAKIDVDTICAKEGLKAQIVTNDGISWFEANNEELFDDRYANTDPTYTYDNEGTAEFATDKNGFYSRYKVLCFDIDKVGEGEAPFGFGIRVDGKILSGKRADEWVQKSIQKGDDE